MIMKLYVLSIIWRKWGREQQLEVLTLTSCYRLSLQGMLPPSLPSSSIVGYKRVQHHGIILLHSSSSYHGVQSYVSWDLLKIMYDKIVGIFIGVETRGCDWCWFGPLIGEESLELKDVKSCVWIFVTLHLLASIFCNPIIMV